MDKELPHKVYLLQKKLRKMNTTLIELLSRSINSDDKKKQEQAQKELKIIVEEFEKLLK